MPAATARKRKMAAATPRTNSPSVEHAGPLAWCAAMRNHMWPCMVAALLAGMLIAHLLDRDSGPVRLSHGQPMAQTALAIVLDDQLASEDPKRRDSPIRIGQTFRDGSGAYCRSFFAARADSVSGIACRRHARWYLPLLISEDTGEGSSSGSANAGENAAQTIRAGVQGMINGQPFSAAAEARARAKIWKN